MSRVERALSGIANLRDLGGVDTRNGRRVRRGMVYRSAMLDPGDAALVAQVGTFGIRTIV
jgi:protein-tyrosine phosphatase